MIEKKAGADVLHRIDMQGEKASVLEIDNKLFCEQYRRIGKCQKRRRLFAAA